MENEEMSVDETDAGENQENQENQADDVGAMKKQIATLQKQKDHYRSKLEKVSSSIKDEEDKPNKPNPGNSTDSLSRSEAKLYAKGYEDDEIETAKKIAVLNRVSIDEAIKDDYVQAKVQARKQAERDKAAQLGSAKSGSFQAKEEPSDRADHQKWYEEQINKIS